MALVAGIAKLHTYAEFLHPDENEPGVVEYSIREVDNRDTSVFPGPPSDAIGVRFFDRVEIDATDEKGVAHQCLSSRTQKSRGIHFYDGVVVALADVKGRSRAVIPGVMNDVLTAMMELHGWTHILHCRGLVLPFNPLTDTHV